MTPRGGFAVAELIPGPPCELCRGEGRRVVERHGIRRVGRCVCQRLPDRVALYNAAGVPAKHANCTLESFRVELARPTWVVLAIALIEAPLTEKDSREFSSALYLFLTAWLLA